MEFEFDNDRPIYIQIVELIRIKIISGEYKIGEKIPSVRELAIMFKVNPNTVQKSLSELENEKLIYTERTNGKYITKDIKIINKIKNNLATEEVNNFLKKMNSIGLDYETVLKYLLELGGKNGLS